MATTTQSDKLREEGNLLYKSGKLEEAIKKYRQAAKRGAPTDSAPLRNLSAAYYEIGNYRQCISTAEQALKLVEDAGRPDMQVQVEKLQTRIRKAKQHFERPSVEEQMQTRIKILRTLGRYRPSMHPVPEHYTIGHDSLTTWFDVAMQTANPADWQISFFFGGIGDARHMFRTFLDIEHHEKSGKTSPKHYHFTIVDVNKYALARDLILFMLLQDLSVIGDASSDEAILILSTIFYVWAGKMIPHCTFEHLQQTISRALVALRAKQQPVKWAHLHTQDFSLYIQALNDWQGKAMNLYTNSAFISQVTHELRNTKASMPPGYSSTPESCRTEALLFTHAAFLSPPRRIMELHDTKVQDLLRKYSRQPKANANVFKAYLCDNWNMNVTMISPEWFEQQKHTDLSHDPYLLVNELYAAGDYPTKPTNASRLYDYVAPFFKSVAHALKHLESRIMVEAIQGDYIDTAERLAFGLYTSSDCHGANVEPEGKWLRPESFPTLYDRIHLSNVPDYTGGHLSTFLHAMPILKKQFSSLVISNCLRNSTVWHSMEQFVAEYQLITDDQMLEQLTQVMIVARGQAPLPMADYTAYGSFATTLKRDFGTLLPRKAFNVWFYGLFFKLALPFFCDITQFSTIVIAPLNFTILFRLLSRLRLIGYPSHWLSEVLTNIIENNVITTCRPPRKLPMDVADVNRIYREKKLTTTHFVPEMSTLTQMFQQLLPFSISSKSLHRLDNIYSYSFKFPDYSEEPSRQNNCLVLVFLDPELFYDMDWGFDAGFNPNFTFRDLVDPSWGDEMSDKVKGPKYEKFRDEGVVMWSTFSFDVMSRTANAWIPEKFIENISEKGWECILYRTDIWTGACNMSYEVGENAVKGERWVDWKNKKEPEFTTDV